MYNFCTLFNSHYLSRGLAMYESLARNCSDFNLYVFTFDEKCYEILSRLKLPKITLVSLKEFEDESLTAVKSSRTAAEYCWTCTPATVLYVIKRFEVESCTYIDADLYWFASPAPLFDELKDSSIIITEHRYTEKYDQSKNSGIYCVQFVTFKNNPEGLKALNWWRDACIDWCYAKPENGKFGDQKYLDDWPGRFGGVHVLENIGGGVAPWNIQQFETYQRNGKTVIREKKTGIEKELIFYHFHQLKFYAGDLIHLGFYNISRGAKINIYRPYVKHLNKLYERIQKIDASFDPHGSLAAIQRNETILMKIKIKIKRLLEIGEDNFYNIEEFTGGNFFL